MEDTIAKAKSNIKYAKFIQYQMAVNILEASFLDLEEMANSVNADLGVALAADVFTHLPTADDSNHLLWMHGNAWDDAYVAWSASPPRRPPFYACVHASWSEDRWLSLSIVHDPKLIL